MNNMHIEIYGAGEPLVLLHGWAMHTGAWRQFAKNLAERYQVICVDLPGHGGSRYQGEITLSMIVTSVLEAVPVESAHWLGWSMGAGIVLAIAERFPEKVRSIALLAGNPCFVNRQNWPGMPEQVLDAFIENFDSHYLRTLQRFIVLQTQSADVQQSKVLLQRLKQSFSEYETHNEHALKAGLLLLKDGDFRNAFADFKGPLFCLLGGQDNLIPACLEEHLQRLNPSAQTALIEDAGHLPFFTHEKETCKLLTEFFD